MLYKGIEQQVQEELQVYQSCQEQFIIKYYSHFQTKSKCYIILENVEGCSLRSLMKSKRFNETDVKFYVSEIILALKFLHQNDIIYRNLTPDNILIDRGGHIKLSDFSLASQMLDCKLITGDIYYQAPEILTGSLQNQLSDYWSLGAIMYELLVGYPPYFSLNMDVYKMKKLQSKLHFPTNLSDNTKLLLKQLLNNDIQARICYNSVNTIINHTFFNSQNWTMIKEKQLTPPRVPDSLTMQDFVYSQEDHKQQKTHQTSQMSTASQKQYLLQQDDL